MPKFIINFLVLSLLMALVVIYFELVASGIGAEAQLFIAAGILPLVVGIAGGLAFRGSYTEKGALSGLVFPFAVLSLEFMGDASVSRDAEADAFLFFYLAWATTCVLLTVVFVYFLRVIVPEKHSGD